MFNFTWQCTLACHKKCLETLAIQCGHKKLHGRLHLFGVDFIQTAKDCYDGIPFIIKKCISEIENRALSIKVRFTMCSVITRRFGCLLHPETSFLLKLI